MLRNAQLRSLKRLNNYTLIDEIIKRLLHLLIGMEKRFYLDTSIWIDYVEDRGDGIRPLGEFAFRFLKYCEERDLEILVSDIVILELQKILSKERINEGFFPFEGIIKYIAATPEQHNEAKREWLKANKKTFLVLTIVNSHNLTQVMTFE